MMPHVTREKGHVAVTFLVDMMPDRGARIAYWFIYLVCFIACSLAFWINLDENIRQIVNDVHLMKVKPIPKYLISVFLTFGFGMSALHFLRFLDYRTIKVGDHGEDFG
jgi:TRAP-type C4-dicarboxylate transport system permease small subunit